MKTPAILLTLALLFFLSEDILAQSAPRQPYPQNQRNNPQRGQWGNTTSSPYNRPAVGGNSRSEQKENMRRLKQENKARRRQLKTEAKMRKQEQKLQRRERKMNVRSQGRPY